MEDNVKKALLDGSATIQTKIEIVKENLLKTPYTENNKLTLTATKDDHYIMTNYYIELEAGKTYTFSCKTTGTFGAVDKQTQVFLMIKEDFTMIHMVNKDGYNFTPTVSGKYYLRYDVNKTGETHSFWDFKIIEGEPLVLTEKNSVVSWDYEDFRYVKDEGWIGQFVARQVNGVVKNISDDFSMTDKEFVLHMGVKIGDNTTWYSLGNFLVNKVTDDEVNDKTSFEALDYTKKFNQTYVDSITYPCTALELAQNVCEQCGCELGNTDFKHNDWEITGNAFTNGESCREVLKAIGKLAYSWVRIDWDNKVYIDFKSPFRNIVDEDLIEIGVYDFGTTGVIPSKITSTTRCTISPENAIKVLPNNTYKIIIPENCQVAIGELTTDKKLIQQSGWKTTTEYIFTTSGTTQYLCMNLIYGNSQTITDEILIIFKKYLNLKEEPDEYNKINNSNYYSLTTQKEKFGAVNRVIIGCKDIEGERTKVEDTESIDANGVNEITIYDNPLVYNQELREKAIVGAEDLFGLEYLPLETLTVGHPWLKGDELVEVTNMEGKVHKTIPFDRTIQYFGHIKTKIHVATNTKINTEYAYESGVSGRLRKTEIMVDKINGQIIEVIEEQDETTKKLNETISTVDETKQTISSVETTVENITTTTQTSTGKNSLHITDALASDALEYHIEGKSEQETRSGKNLWNNPSDSTKNGITLTNNNDGTINLVGTSTGLAEFVIYVPIEEIGISNGETYTLSCNQTVIEKVSITVEVYNGTTWISAPYIVSSTAQTKTNSLDISNATHIRFAIKVTKADATVNYTHLGIQFEKGSTATDWEQYGVSPSPDYPSEIKTIPSIRNLINPNEIISGGYSVGNGNYFSSETSFCTKYKIKIDNTKPYYLSHNVNNANQYYYVLYYDENENYLGHISSLITTKTMDLSTYTNYSQAKYINIRFEAPISYINEIQLEEGSIAHDYVPYGTWAKVKVTGKNLFDFKNWKPSVANGTMSINIDEEYLTLTANSANDCYTFGGKKFLVKENTKYTFKVDTDATTIVAFWTLFYDKDSNKIGTWIQHLRKTDGGDIEKTLITPANTKYVMIRVDNDVADTTVKYTNFYLAEEDTFSGYETYKEQEVLIDLNKPNLFDKNNVKRQGYENGSVGATTNRIDSTTRLLSEDINVSSNTSYSFELGTTKTLRYNIFELDENNTILKVTATTTNVNTTFTTLSNTKKVSIMILWQTTTNEIILDDIRDCNIKLYEGYTDYYELCSIGDIKDTLDIVNGQVVIYKKIDKVVFNGSENWVIAKSNNTTDTSVRFWLPFSLTKTNYAYRCLSSHYKESRTWDNHVTDNNSIVIFLHSNWTNETGRLSIHDNRFTNATEFKTWLSENNTTVCYELAEPQQIILPNTNIPLFEDINHIALVDDLETTTGIKFLRQTPISNEYATNQQLNETNYNLANTTSQSNENTANINATNTNLNNNYYTKPQIDIMNTATTEEITTIKKEVETKITAEDLTIAINQIKTTGATSVETTTGYKFNEEGLSIQKSGSEMSSLLDNDGLVVKRNDTEMLTVRSSGVEAENITVRTYFTIGDNTRAENYKGGTGFFYIGGDD